MPGRDHNIPVSESPDSILDYGIVLLEMSVILSESLQLMHEVGFPL
jgi:hypothetical protein